MSIVSISEVFDVIPQDVQEWADVVYRRLADRGGELHSDTWSDIARELKHIKGHKGGAVLTDLDASAVEQRMSDLSQSR